MSPRSCSGGPKSSPRGPKTAPRAARSAPRGAQEQPGAHQKGPKRGPGRPRSAKKPPGALREAPGAHFGIILGSTINRIWGTVKKIIHPPEPPRDFLTVPIRGGGRGAPGRGAGRGGGRSRAPRGAAEMGTEQSGVTRRGDPRRAGRGKDVFWVRFFFFGYVMFLSERFLDIFFNLVHIYMLF